MLEKLPKEVGQALRSARPGLAALTFNDQGLERVDLEIVVRSSAFADGGPMGPRYTADGPGVSPPLEWSGVPVGAQTLVLLIEDADSPTPEPLVHAIAYNLPAPAGMLEEAALPSANHRSEGILMGRASDLRTEYLPPDPPRGHGRHRYAFQLFALEAPLSFGTPPGRSDIVEALRERAVAKGVLIGTYERS
jgi:Raf kinase inhibitor-like YbhB/YbcL family protein